MTRLKSKKTRKLKRQPKITVIPKSKGSHVYQPWMCEKAEELVGKLGARNEDLAMYFGVNVTSIEYWIKNKPDFYDAVTKGRIRAGMVMAKSLYMLGTGFTVPSKKIFCNAEGDVTRVPYNKYYAPNAFAAHKYLTIMFRHLGWSDNVKHEHHHSGEINHNHRKVEDIPLEELTQEQQDLLFEINMKQLKDVQRN